ncbi:MAG: beta-lactamase family protein [Xanthomonadales bacterium]|nr:beta-lactamase family protein [Xanthomonadales bacterium]
MIRLKITAIPRRLLCVAFAAFAAWAVAQQQEQALRSPEDVNGFVQSAMVDVGIPGAAMTMIEGGQINLARGFGRLDDTGNAVSAQAPFQIASVSKSFTALVVLQLADEARLAIDDLVVEYLPDFRMADSAHAGAVTIRQLLNHTSGFATLDGNRLHGIGSDDPGASEKAVRQLGDSRPIAAPGERFQYSNANYIVLGHLIETIEQKPYEQVLDERIFSRLGMANSYAFKPLKQTAEAAKGHEQWFGIARQNHRTPGRATLAAGGISASAEDLGKYLRALTRADPRIVPPILARSFADAEFTGYAFGWHHAMVDGRRVIYHDGLSPGFRALAAILPDERRAAAFVMNLSGILGGNLHIGAVHHALGLHPVPIRPSGGIITAIWGSLATTLCFALGCFAALRKAFTLRHTPWNTAEAFRWILVVVPSAVFAGGAYALLVLVPRSLALDFAGTGVFYPDLAAVLLATAAIGVVWAVVLPILLVKRPKAAA